MRILQTVILLSFFQIYLIPYGATGDKMDQEQLQGTWEVTELVINGMTVPKEALKEQKWTFIFVGDKLTTNKPSNKDRREFTYKLDAKKNPRAIDMTALDGPDKGKTNAAIYQLEGATLRICVPYESGKMDRPTEFVSKAGSNILLLTLSRVKE